MRRRVWLTMQILIQTLIDGLLMGGIYGIASVGLSIIFGTIKIVNFAHGEWIMVGMYATYFVWSFTGGIDPFVGLIITIPIMFFFGLIVFFLTIRPILYGKGNDSAFIFSTVGTSLLLQNLALLFCSANYLAIKTPYTGKAFQLLGISVSVPRIYACITAVALSFVLTLFLSKSYLGKAIRAAAQDRDTATLMGIKHEKVFIITMGIGAITAGVAGTALMPFFYVFPTVGVSFSLISFVVAIIGGLGNLKGAFICGLILGVTEALGTHYIASDAGLLVAFALLIVVLIFRPQGLWPQSTMRRGG